MSATPPPDGPATIDRQKVVPFLLNFCYRSSAFHNLTDFPIPTPSNPAPPLPAHVEIYTWMDCTLRELAQLLTSALPSIVPSPAIGTRLAFRLVYPDTMPMRGAGGRLDGEGRGRYISREIGSVVISAPQENGETNGKTGRFDLGGEDAEKTLDDARFVIGDFVDVAVFPPLSDGSVVSRASIHPTGRGNRESAYSFRGSHSGFGPGRGRGEFAPHVPAGEWRRGERPPEPGFRGGRGRPRY
jgi:histone deacetylase complex subunit SAP18